MNAAELLELKSALAAHANQNQVLTLRNVEPEGHNSRLLERLRYPGRTLRSCRPRTALALTGASLDGSRRLRRCS